MNSPPPINATATTAKITSEPAPPPPPSVPGSFITEPLTDRSARLPATSVPAFSLVPDRLDPDRLAAVVVVVEDAAAAIRRRSSALMGAAVAPEGPGAPLPATPGADGPWPGGVEPGPDAGAVVVVVTGGSAAYGGAAPVPNFQPSTSPSCTCVEPAPAREYV